MEAAAWRKRSARAFGTSRRMVGYVLCPPLHRGGGDVERNGGTVLVRSASGRTSLPLLLGESSSAPASLRPLRRLLSLLWSQSRSQQREDSLPSASPPAFIASSTLCFRPNLAASSLRSGFLGSLHLYFEERLVVVARPTNDRNGFSGLAAFPADLSDNCMRHFRFKRVYKKTDVPLTEEDTLVCSHIAQPSVWPLSG